MKVRDHRHPPATSPPGEGSPVPVEYDTVRHVADRDAFWWEWQLFEGAVFEKCKIADNVAVVRKSSLHFVPMTIINERLQLGLWTLGKKSVYYVWNILCELTVTNVARMRSFEVVSVKFNLHRVCTAVMSFSHNAIELNSHLLKC